MSLFYDIAERLDENGGVPTTEIINDAITEHSALSKRTYDSYERYQQGKAATPILTRYDELPEDEQKKINNKLANDYFGEIIDTKVGYVFGIPVSIEYDKAAANHQNVVENINRFAKINNLDDLNAEVCKTSSIGGYDAMLCYIDKAAQPRVMRVDPWEAIIISKTAFTEPEYGIIYYKKKDGKCCAEFYNSTTKYIFEGTSYDKMSIVSTKPHPFGGCPLLGVPNNAELQGDGDKVFTLIDAFDRAMSDMNNEIEQFRLAYMIFVGYAPDEKELARMVKTGALYIPDSQNGEKIDWLVKDLNPQYPDSHLDRLEANITRFAKHVNFTDAAFGGDITGPAMRYKLFALETKSKYFERKHEAAMLYLFKLVGSIWGKKGIAFDYALLDLKYKRNIPANLLDEAQTAATLMAVASHETALSVVSVVNDVKEEMEKIRKEREERIDLDNINLDDDPNKDEV